MIFVLIQNGHLNLVSWYRIWGEEKKMQNFCFI